MRMLALCLVAACSSPAAPAPPPEHPAPPPVAVVTPDAAVPDAGVPDEVTNAQAYVFKFTAPDRVETWTIKWANGNALVVVEAAKGTTRYLGTATEGPPLALAVTSGPNKMTLACKKEKLAVSAKCGDTKAKQREVLNCYHPDYKAPMPFAPAPGIEYSTTAKCNGYRLLE